VRGFGLKTLNNVIIRFVPYFITILYTKIKNTILAQPQFNEQLYSLTVRSKLALFSPWAKKHAKLKLLVDFKI
jgi:hypothetical protein